MSGRIHLVLLLASLVLALPSCRTTTGALPPSDAGKKQQLLPPQRKLYMGTKETRTEINELLARLNAAGPQERASIQQRLPKYGEPAVAPLSDALSHPTTIVRVAAAFALGQIKDPRSLDALASRLGDPDEGVRFEVATAMLRMDDRRGLDTLIYGLEHPDPSVRARSILVLQERTGQRRGYKADDRPVDRMAAVARWRAWAQTQHSDW